MVKSKYGTAKDGIIVAGISAGGSSAVFSAFRSGVPVKRIITVCSGIPESLSGKDYIKKPGIEVIMIGGENDYYRPRQERLRDSLTLYSVKNSYSIIPGMGHEYPENFRTLLNNLL
jgi:predicted esterase